MYYVYILKSLNFPEQNYVGYTKNLEKRLSEHNDGSSIYTSKYKPWNLITFIGFADQQKAITFEKYLKSHAGRAFLSKRFL